MKKVKCVVYVKSTGKGKVVRELVREAREGAEALGYEVVKEYVDEEQGPQEPRKQLMRLLPQSISTDPGYSVVVTPSLKIFGRGAHNPFPCANWLADNHIHVVAVDAAAVLH